MEDQALFDENQKLKNKKNKRKNRKTSKKFINHNIFRCNLESITKYILLIIFLIIFSFAISFLLFNENNLLKPNTIQKSSDNISNIINNELEKEQNNNLTCFPKKDKILWKNQKNLDIARLRKKFRNKELLEISYENPDDLIQREKPKISLIITIYNQEQYIKNLYAYILKQEFKDIEIIFVDDASFDNSASIIKQLMEKDKRIIYLKNDINQRQFISINNGILNSKGEYILVIDPDDLLINNILIKAYETAKYYNLDILQFYVLTSYKLPQLWKIMKYKNGIICNNSNVRKIFYYGVTRNLCDKLIRREIYLKSIKFMKKELYNEDYHIHTDDTIFFGVIHFAKSYGFLEQIGYYYNLNPNRKKDQKNKKSKEEIANEDMKSLFNIMKYFMLQSDDNIIEKNYTAYKFFIKKVKKEHEDYINHITNGFDFYFEVLDMYLNCSFFNEENKKEIRIFKDKIIQRKNDLNYTIK